MDLGQRARPLLVTGDPALRDGLLRLAAVTGADPQVVGPGQEADVRPSWAATPLVLVGADSADLLVRLRLPRREGVLLVTVAGTNSTDPALWQRALAAGAERVVALAEDSDLLADLLGASTDGVAGAPLVCVIGGCGGSGASVFAAGLAGTAAASGTRAVLVDADPSGGGLDLIVGTEHADGLRWADLTATTGRLGAASLRELLPRAQGLAVLTWQRGTPVGAAPLPLPVPAESMRAVITAAQRGHDLVVADLPRHLDAAADEALASAAYTVLVLPAEVRAVAAATSVVAALAGRTTSLGSVVRTGPSGLDPQVVADSLGLPLLAAMRPERRLTEALDHGLGPLRRRRGPLARACAEVLQIVRPLDPALA